MLLIVGDAAKDQLGLARSNNLWRALAEMTETWRLDLVEQVSVSCLAGHVDPRPSYRELVRQVREAIATHVPADAIVLVVSKGDEDLLELDSRRGWHFPETGGGVYAGEYPPNAALAVEHLEDLRLRGAEYLVFPKTAVWWLDHYEGFREHLESSHPTVFRDNNCIIFGLCSRRAEGLIGARSSPPEATMSLPEDSTRLRRRQADRTSFEAELTAVLAESAADCVVLAGEDVFALAHENKLSGRRVIAAPLHVTDSAVAALSQVADRLSEVWVRSPAEKSMLVAAGLTPKRVLVADCFQLTAATDVAAALGLEPAVDPLETGRRVARNLDISVSVDTASFHPWAGLYLLDIDLFGSVTSADVSGYFEATGGDAGLTNAWVSVSPRGGCLARLHATAALSEDVAPESVTVVVLAWGWPVARVTPSGMIVEERAGLIGINVQFPDKVVVDYWGDPGQVRIQLGRKTVEAEPLSTRPKRPATYRITADFPFDRETLTALPETGRSRAFTSFATYFAARGSTSARLQDMKGVCSGQSAWLIGNGPSVRVEDLDRLADEGHLCFGFNRFYLAHEDTRLRPAFTVTGDKQMIEDFGPEIVDRSGGHVFVAHDRPPELPGDYIWVRQVGVFPSLFSYDVTRLVTPGGSSLYVAMQIGYFLGIRRWYVYGADFTFRFKRDTGATDVFHAASGEGNHFIEDYRSGRTWCPPSIENILPSFHAARQLMELEGGFIRNATRGGTLEVFERVDFHTALDTA